MLGFLLLLLAPGGLAAKQGQTRLCIFHGCRHRSSSWHLSGNCGPICHQRYLAIGRRVPSGEPASELWLLLSENKESVDSTGHRISELHHRHDVRALIDAYAYMRADPSGAGWGDSERIVWLAGTHVAGHSDQICGIFAFV